MSEYIVILIPTIGFVISEILPWFTKSKSVSHLIINCIKIIIKIYNPIISEETTPLLNEIERMEQGTNCDLPEETITKPTNLNENLNVKLINLSNLENSLNTITTQFENLQNIQREPVLHPKEIYELNFIINYIKNSYPKKGLLTKNLSESNQQLLLSKGYIINYDSIENQYSIKW
jgi:hypothetical protein